MKSPLVAFLALVAFPTQAQVLEGPARAVDGDSLEMTGARIRLFGIDAPEGRQTCKRDAVAWPYGKETADRLATLIADRQVTCEQRDIDTHSRIVAVCSAGGLDINRMMVEAGLAIALPQFSEAYVEAEARARSASIGIWGSEFQPPAAYRAANPSARLVASNVTARQRRSASPTAGSAKPYSGGCVIKGNRNRKGQWIYHLPGMPYYDATRPEEMFCSEVQAQAAGYRRAIVKP